MSPKGEGGGEVSILIPHPLSLVVNVNFYSCPKTDINPSLTALDPSTRIQPTPLVFHRRVRGGEVSVVSLRRAELFTFTTKTGVSLNKGHW